MLRVYVGATDRHVIELHGALCEFLLFLSPAVISETA
jgi:hypothetical protein